MAAGAVAAAPAMAADTGTSTGSNAGTTNSNTANSNTASTNTATTNAAPVLDRVGGSDRYLTALNASQTAFKAGGSAKGVVIARGDLYVDALAGTPLAAKSGSALLLTDSKSLTPGVAAEIKRVLGTGDAAKGKKITILGGEAAITPAVENQLRALGYGVERIGGFDRYATALDIAHSSTLNAKNAIVATGANFADALSAGPLAAAAPDSAIVLSNGTTVTDAATAAFIKGAGTVTSVGTPAVTAVNKLGVKDTELAGADRYATAAAVATKSILKDSRTAVVANGLTSFADPLVGGVFAASNHGALLLTDPAHLPPTTAAALVGFSAPLQHVTIFGGLQAVSQGVQTQIQLLLNGGYTVYIDQLKAAVVKAQADVATAQKGYDGTVADTAAPGAALVAFDTAVAGGSDNAVKTAEKQLFDGAKVSTDVKVKTAYTGYGQALAAFQGAGAHPSQAIVDALSVARWNLEVAIDAPSTDAAVTNAAAALDAAVKATSDATITAADAASTKAAQGYAVAVKAASDKLTAAQAALAAAQKALADAQA
ncbi:hypothetical protein GCM10009839_36390 [Catenulispora yoronensis]|uniref:Cell wall-binding repeat-containing protein n=2 Tax=Catenulispora yoronensis TaxID=450799 RepID=A0ABN2UBS9_9ACTN